MKKYSLYLIAAIAIVAIAAKPISKPDFTGTWTINMQKNEFNGAPSYTAPKQLKVAQTTTGIDIAALITANSGADSTMNEKLTFDGKPFMMKTADQRTRQYTGTLTENDLKIDYSSTYANDPVKEEYHTTETWTLTPDGKSIIITKEVKVVSGYAYAIKAIYDKR